MLPSATSTPYINPEHVDRSMFNQEGMNASFNGNTAAQSQPQQQQQQDHFGQFGMTAQNIGHQRKHTGQAAFHAVQPSVAIHTPPPTRNPSEKRRQPRPHSIMFGTPTSMDQSMNGQSLIDHSQPGILQQSASQPLLPMAMDFSQTSMMGPPSAIPDEDFWNLSTSMSMNNLSQNGPGSMLADPFTYQAQPNNMGSTMPTNEQIQFLATTPQLFTPVQPSPLQRAPVVPSNAEKPLPPVPTDNVPNMVRTSAGVDPNLLWSSPLRMAPPALPRPLVPSTQNDSLSPERIPQMPFPSSAASLATTQLSMQPERNSIAVPGGLKPGLRRSNTTETRRPHSMYGSIESLSRSNTTASISRRASPLKRYNRNSTTSLASISESTPSLPRSRTSVVLTVDSKGRARAETRPMDISPTKSSSMMARYPSLWDSEDDSDSDDTTGRDKHTRAAKIDSTLASLEGLHLPRSTSSASNRATPSKAAIAAAISLRRQSSVKKSQSSQSRRNTLASNGSHMDVDAMDVESDNDSSNGDAGAALRKAMAERREQREQRKSAAEHQRARSRPPSQTRPASVYPPRSSSLANNLGAAMQQQQLPQVTQSFDSAPMHLPSHSHSHSHSHSQSFSHPQSMAFSHGHSHSFSHSHAFSPQASSPIKPSGSFADAMSSITRCICNLPIAEGQLMIQCNSCQLWLHTACLGISPAELPQTYMCTFCMVPPAPGQRMMGWETTAAF
ncbi:Histone deacetylase complex subunit cti6-like protein 2 [Elsinoe fawcettii]|nr:Histone deacetylase complex subunit cti6-like protein 2 [Elsinoe fawcettii]